MEAIFVSLFSPGESIVSVNNGKFGERWVTMPRAFGLEVEEIRLPWGQAPGPEQILAALRRRPRARAVVLTHSETSTGTATDVRAIAAAVRSVSDALILVDGITAVGAIEFRFDAWGIDACVTGSQKGLMMPPGLAFVALSGRAVEALAAARLPRFALDLGKALEAREKGDTPWTPAVPLVAAADTALEMIVSQDMERIWERHRRLAGAVRAGITALGLRLLSVSPSDAVTAVLLPEGVAWSALQKSLKERDGIVLAGGQGPYQGTLFRIAHLGWFDELDMVTVLAGLERALAACGYTFRAGCGVAAVHEALLQDPNGDRAHRIP
jgi:aspartate aminotransferase-like enzyme